MEIYQFPEVYKALLHLMRELGECSFFFSAFQHRIFAKIGIFLD